MKKIVLLNTFNWDGSAGYPFNLLNKKTFLNFFMNLHF